MEQQHIEAPVHPQGRPDFPILVNEKYSVLVHDNRMTGLQIKQAAIDQGVPIQIDFVLSEERPNWVPKIVGDNDTITVNKNSKFHAVSPDDNS